MKNTAHIPLVFVFAVVSGKSSACESILHDTRSDLKNAQSIVIGYVTGNRHTYYENHLLSGGDPNNGQIGDVIVRVAPTEAIKGTKPTQIIEVVADCMGTSPKTGKRVVVIRTSDRNYLVEYSGYEKELREAMSRGR